MYAWTVYNTLQLPANMIVLWYTQVGYLVDYHARYRGNLLFSYLRYATGKLVTSLALICKHTTWPFNFIAAASEQECIESVAVGVSVAIIGVCVGICGFLFTTIKALRSKRYGVM